MSRLHLVRVGALSHVGRFSAVDATAYPRGQQVIVRTRRGLEVGEVLAPPQGDGAAAQPDGTILRGMTIQDRLLKERLDRGRDAAYDACQARLKDLGLPAALMDVEHLFDGKTVVFYFLGEPRRFESLGRELADVYDEQVQFRSFADALTDGCGPGCGTEQASGQGCTDCAAGCSIAGSCHPRRRQP